MQVINSNELLTFQNILITDNYKYIMHTNIKTNSIKVKY